ncbi:MAG TPA: hypothetical protein VH721_06830 [Gaiellaceae bacterium]
MRSRAARILLAVAAALALAATGIAVNFVLLGYADSRHDPVGKLSPRATITQKTPPSSAQTVGGHRGEGDDHEADD